MTSTELVGLRTPNSKTFSRGKELGGTETRDLIISRDGPIHYLTEDGFAEIRPEWKRQVDGLWSVSGVGYTMTVPAGEIGFRFSSNGNRVNGRMILESGWNVPEPTPSENRLWWIGAADGMDVCLIAAAETGSLQRVLHSDRAPRSAVMSYWWDKGMEVRELRGRGRDNINDLESSRADADMWRELEIVTEIHNSEELSRTVRTTWTGRVAEIKDPATRKKAWSYDAVYPVRIR